MMMSGFLSGKAYLDPQKSYMKYRKIAFLLNFEDELFIIGTLFLTRLFNTFLIS
jgi:hypothetical protein